jgi:cytochrome c biogenesis protein CcmG, thiol:disulfide interchange protein DsbE
LTAVSARTFAVFMAALAVVGLLAYGLLTKGTSSLAAGDAVPASTLPQLDGSGSSSLADYRGRWVLVNVWASWCVPCRDDSPALERFQRAHRGERFMILGVDSNDLSADALAFTSRYGITYPQLRDGNGDYSQDELGTTGVPESFLVDPRGRLVLHRLGPVTPDYLDSNVVPYLTGKAKQ